jgi:MFS family permease
VIGRLLGLSLWLPLKDRLFRRLFVGEGVALLADQMFLISLTLLVLEVAGPGAQLGSVLAVASIPGALLMLVGGWVSDRFPPAAVLVVSNAGRAAPENGPTPKERRIPPPRAVASLTAYATPGGTRSSGPCCSCWRP